MPDPRLENLAKILVNYSTRVQPGDRVCITAQPAAAPLVRELFRYVLRAGGYPYLRATIPGVSEIFLNEANDDQLSHVNRWYEMQMTEFEVLIAVRSLTNTRYLNNIPSENQVKVQQANAHVQQRYFERSAAGEFRWVVTMYPTNAYAQDADMSLSDFENYVYQTTFADQPDPVAKWEEVAAMQARVIDYLKDKKQLEVTGPNVDLRLSIEGRTFINSRGRLNMPDGEIYTGPVEDSVEGWAKFTYPSVHLGRIVSGHELHFEKGKVVRASAERNEDYLLQMLDSDEGARYLGEFAIATNTMIDRFIKEILFDEKIGGTIHMAVGRGYPETGSVNKSAIHWDMICDMRDGGEIKADGEAFYRSGEFLI